MNYLYAHPPAFPVDLTGNIHARQLVLVLRSKFAEKEEEEKTSEKKLVRCEVQQERVRLARQSIRFVAGYMVD